MSTDPARSVARSYRVGLTIGTLLLGLLAALLAFVHGWVPFVPMLAAFAGVQLLLHHCFIRPALELARCVHKPGAEKARPALHLPRIWQPAFEAVDAACQSRSRPLTSPDVGQVVQDSEAQLRAVVEDQTELICRYDADFRLTFSNRAHARLFGVEPEMLLGQDLFSRFRLSCVRRCGPNCWD